MSNGQCRRLTLRAAIANENYACGGEEDWGIDCKVMGYDARWNDASSLGPSSLDKPLGDLMSDTPVSDSTTCASAVLNPSFQAILAASKLERHWSARELQVPASARSKPSTQGAFLQDCLNFQTFSQISDRPSNNR